MPQQPQLRDSLPAFKDSERRFYRRVAITQVRWISRIFGPIRSPVGLTRGGVTRNGGESKAMTPAGVSSGFLERLSLFSGQPFRFSGPFLRA